MAPLASLNPACCRNRGRMPMTEPLVVRRETQIAAPPATVFAFLTDPDKILRWMGTEAGTEPQAGGAYLVKGVAGTAKPAARGAVAARITARRGARVARSFRFIGWPTRSAGTATTPCRQAPA